LFPTNLAAFFDKRIGDILEKEKKQSSVNSTNFEFFFQKIPNLLISQI
jgi:hypothetical protein